MSQYAYRGRWIVPCERVKGEHAGRWRLLTWHEATGYQDADEACPHFKTLAAAREATDADQEVGR